MRTNTDSPTCIKCGTRGLTWAQSVKGKWYLGTPVEHTFEDGNTIITHTQGHDCTPTAEGLAAFETARQEKEAERLAEQAKFDAYKADQDKLHHVDAEIGEVVELTGVVTMATTVETQFGSSRLVIIKTDDYQVAKMFTTANWAWDVDFDEAITVKGTVGSHDDYQGTSQTTLKRPKRIVAQ